MNSLDTYRPAGVPGKLPPLAVAKIAPHQMDVMIDPRDNRRALAEALNGADPMKPALRVAEMTISCSGELEKLLGKSDVRIIKADQGDIEIKRVAPYQYQVVINKVLGREVYSVFDDGSVLRFEFNNHDSLNEGEGHVAPQAAGAALFNTAELLLKKYGAAKLQVN